MDYTEFLKTELSKFRLVLNECGIVGEEWRRLMAIKINLLKGQFNFEHNPQLQRQCLKVQPLVRVYGSDIVWNNGNGGVLNKISIADFNRLTGPNRLQPQLTPLISSIFPAGKIRVFFPSESAEDFRPSTECVFQQLPQFIRLFRLLFEVQTDNANVCQCYNRVLKCHTATVQLYYYNFNTLSPRPRLSELPTKASRLEDLEVRKVREVNKVKEPEKPNKVIRTQQRSH